MRFFLMMLEFSISVYSHFLSPPMFNFSLQSEERNGTPSRRSKSEGPPAVPNGRAFAIPTEVDGPETKQVC